MDCIIIKKVEGNVTKYVMENCVEEGCLVLMRFFSTIGYLSYVWLCCQGKSREETVRIPSNTFVFVRSKPLFQSKMQGSNEFLTNYQMKDAKS